MAPVSTSPTIAPIIHRTAAIVSCGDEITLGQTLDTNSKWIASQLADAGVVTVEHVTLPDDVDAQRRAFERLGRSVDLIVASGGLGPTADDLTRQALAMAGRDTLVEDPTALSQIEAWFKARGRAMGALNRVQAQRPSRGRCLENRNGTAPGLHLRLDNGEHPCDVFCLPGPPRELFPMFQAEVLPSIRLEPGRVVQTRVLHTFGMGESDIALKLGSMMQRDGDLLVGTTASNGVVSCRVRYEGSAPLAEVRTQIDEVERRIRELLGPYVFGAGSDTLASTAIQLLVDRGQTLGVVESCTGGMLGQLITDLPGASRVFQGGLITYANQLKTALASVPESVVSGEGSDGAVSRACVVAMAEGGLEALKVDHALAVTGIAGPEGGSAAKPVGTVWIARASRGVSGVKPAVDVRRFQMSGDRASVREWSARSALAMLVLALRGHAEVRMLRQADESAP